MLLVNNLKEKQLFPAQMNRYRFDLILARRYWNCSIMENLRYLTSDVDEIIFKTVRNSKEVCLVKV